MQQNPYPRFMLMLGISFAVMYAVMFLNVDRADHVYLSLTRFYMTLLMVAPMALVMLGFMRHMYTNKKLNLVIALVSVGLFFLSLFLLRSQIPVHDEQYMKAMIPHHSSAIMVSQSANISDPELKKLAEQIIVSQEKEIAEMKAILERLKATN